MGRTRVRFDEKCIVRGLGGGGGYAMGQGMGSV